MLSIQVIFVKMQKANVIFITFPSKLRLSAGVNRCLLAEMFTPLITLWCMQHFWLNSYTRLTLTAQKVTPLSREPVKEETQKTIWQNKNTIKLKETKRKIHLEAWRFFKVLPFHWLKMLKRFIIDLVLNYPGNNKLAAWKLLMKQQKKTLKSPEKYRLKMNVLRWLHLSLCEILKVFLPCQRLFDYLTVFISEDPFSFLYCLKMLVCLVMWNLFL